MPTADLSVVSRSLRDLLKINIERIAGSAATTKVTIGYPEEQTNATRTINLHLYHVAEDQFNRNLPGPAGSDDVATTPMSLSLFYLVTAHHDAATDKAIVEQEIMGYALKTLHDFALIGKNTLVADETGQVSPVLLDGIDDGTTRLEIVLRPLTPEDALAYWASEQQQAVRLSAYYEVRLVQLMPEVPRFAAGPVLRVGQWVGPRTEVALSASRSGMRFARPAGIGDALPDLIEITPARAFLDVPPIDATFPDTNRFWLNGRGFSSGIRRRLVIAHDRWAARGVPGGEIAMTTADPPAAAADTHWGVAFSTDRVDVHITPSLDYVDAAGVAQTIDLVPGAYRARVEVVVGDQSVGPIHREIVRPSNDVLFQIAPRLRDAQPPVVIAGNPAAPPPADQDRHRVTLRIAPRFNLKSDDVRVMLVIDGQVYAQVANFDPVPALNDGTFRLLTSSLDVQPLFDVTAPGLHAVRLTVNGVDAQPFWLETGP